MIFPLVHMIASNSTLSSMVITEKGVNMHGVVEGMAVYGLSPSEDTETMLVCRLIKTKV